MDSGTHFILGDRLPTWYDATIQLSKFMKKPASTTWWDLLIDSLHLDICVVFLLWLLFLFAFIWGISGLGRTLQNPRINPDKPEKSNFIRIFTMNIQKVWFYALLTSIIYNHIRNSAINNYASALRDLWVRSFGEEFVIAKSAVMNRLDSLMRAYHKKGIKNIWLDQWSTKCWHLFQIWQIILGDCFLAVPRCIM